MCKMRVVIRKDLLGMREQGFSVWSGKDVQELTSKQIKDIIRLGKEKVCGLKIGESGELELDKEGFYTTNMIEHRMCGNYKPMYDEESMVNMMYTVIGSSTENGKTVYECISSRFEQAKLSEEEVRAYIKIGVISSGAKLDGEKIVVASLEYPKPEPVKESQKVEEKKPEPVKKDEPVKEPEKSEEKVVTPLDEKIVSVEVEKVKPGKANSKK